MFRRYRIEEKVQKTKQAGQVDTVGKGGFSIVRHVEYKVAGIRKPIVLAERSSQVRSHAYQTQLPNIWLNSIFLARHPNIVFPEFFGVDEYASTYIQLMSLAARKSLDQYPLAIRDIPHVAKSIYSVLNFSHQTLHVAHGDVKTGNILLNNKGVVQLCDFDGSISEYFRENKRTRFTMSSGNAPISSETCPESGDLYTAAKNADRYGFGIILFELYRGPGLNYDTKLSINYMPIATMIDIVQQYYLPILDLIDKNSQQRKMIAEKLKEYIAAAIRCGQVKLSVMQKTIVDKLSDFYGAAYVQSNLPIGSLEHCLIAEQYRQNIADNLEYDAFWDAHPDACAIIKALVVDFNPDTCQNVWQALATSPFLRDANVNAKVDTHIASVHALSDEQVELTIDVVAYRFQRWLIPKYFDDSFGRYFFGQENVCKRTGTHFLGTKAEMLTHIKDILLSLRKLTQQPVQSVAPVASCYRTTLRILDVLGEENETDPIMDAKFIYKIPSVSRWQNLCASLGNNSIYRDRFPELTEAIRSYQSAKPKERYAKAYAIYKLILDILALKPGNYGFVEKKMRFGERLLRKLYRRVIQELHYLQGHVLMRHVNRGIDIERLPPAFKSKKVEPEAKHRLVSAKTIPRIDSLENLHGGVKVYDVARDRNGEHALLIAQQSNLWLRVNSAGTSGYSQVLALQQSAIDQVYEIARCKS